ncbi:MAG: sensor histidine kinase KdpD [Hyphomicrobiales bacterium]|nr:MAG: sensor histidine kinase KdpD [Hyphomicrobiales bacterium]
MPETRPQEPKRPSPKSLLQVAAQEGRGKLKVFLGMAPGVGKTYAMLSAARALKADGVDVVVGLVETHGRSETAALLDDLEVLPRKPVEYRRRTLMEFDVDGAIARRPKLLLVDEFAHSNAPGMLHVKRYQDVEEVLLNGIDVWTTLNIQHLESLSDVVERITGVRVQETVPDKVLERADEVVVVDLPPEDLIQRLKDGKVYLPENARRAIDQFFRPGNLIALRELALRRTADRVDDQMLAQLRQQGIEGPWPTADRLLVLVGADPFAEKVIRTASRLAAAQKADWVALHLSSFDGNPDRSLTRRIEKSMRLAQRLGASTARLNAKDLTAELLAYAARNNITQIVIGKSKAGWWGRLTGRSLSRDLVARAQGLAITIIAPDEVPRPRWQLSLPDVNTMGSAIGVAAAAVTVAAGLAIGLERLTPLPNVSLIFLVAVLACAMRFGLASAIAASVLSSLVYNFFFIEPRYSFTIAEPYEVLALIIFLIVSFISGTMAARLRQHMEASRERAQVTEALFDFSAKLSAAGGSEEVLQLLAHQVAQLVRGKCVVLIGSGSGLSIRASWPPEDRLETADLAAARWSLEKREPAGRGTGTLPTARYEFRPMGTSASLGVVGYEPVSENDVLPAATAATLQSFIEQASIALERTTLVDRATAAEREAENERLRGAVLSAVSHDLRTPLASILGSVTSLRTLGDKMPKAEREDLLATIEEEADRLARFVTNLLDMTKLEAGAVEIRTEDIDIVEPVNAAIAHARTLFPDREITLQAPARLPEVRADATLLEQVVFNLLDNAHKFTPARRKTEVRVDADAKSVSIAVTDQGVGIPREALQKVFEKFYRVADADGRPAGTGLGLSICAGLVKAMGGTIVAESPVKAQQGTRMTVRLPLDVAAPREAGASA